MIGHNLGMRCLGALAAVLLPLAAGAVTMDMVTISDTNNPANSTGYGSVGYTYQIGKYEVFNSQYAEFLNSVAATDTYGLYNINMDSDARGGIIQNGSAGSFTYSVKPGYESMPVVHVSFYDAVRFANWLQNGQPTGAQGAGTTETGSYTLFTDGTATTNVSARTSGGWLIPTEDEWYKAAYYDPGPTGPSDDWWLYPTQSDSVPNSRQPNGTDANSANFYRDVTPSGDGVNDGYAKTLSTTLDFATNYLTDVGAYSLADSYYGTFDQGGNVEEWNETIISGGRGLRGGNWGGNENYLRSEGGSSRGFTPAWNEGYSIGFRVAAIPEPSAVAGVLIAAVGLCAWKRKRR